MVRCLAPGFAAVALLAAALPSLAADPRQTQPQPPPKPGGASLPDDVPPFVHARGGEAVAGGANALYLAISGLKRGYARVGAGSRIFGVCWSGGVAPYSVTLSNPKGRITVNERGIDGNELIKSSTPVQLEPGFYHIAVGDSAGAHVEGDFEVVPPSTLPSQPRTGSNADTLRWAQSLDKLDIAYDYEAYLMALPLTTSAQDPDAIRLLTQLCHLSR